MAEPRKILGIPDLPVVATSVRVPVLVGHATSILAEFSRPISVDEARRVIDAAPGVELRDDALMPQLLPFLVGTFGLL